MLSFSILPCEQQTVQEKRSLQKVYKKWNINVKYSSVNIIKIASVMYLKKKVVTDRKVCAFMHV